MRGSAFQGDTRKMELHQATQEEELFKTSHLILP